MVQKKCRLNLCRANCRRAEGPGIIRAEENRIGYGSLSVYATPRRMALLVRQADDRQTDEQVKKRGPSVQAAFDSEGNPTKAAQGFARGQQVNPGSLKTEDGYVWAEKQ